ncbi:MAG: NAD(+) diphosphatase [Actinomycetota bacterium]|nr:NAD(+) diphosphatase [Actinomycetota bacterium]
MSDELALSRHPHDRLGNQRVDDAWIAARWDDPGSRVLLLHQGSVAVDESGEAPVYVSPERAGEGERVLLGLQDGTTYFALIRDEEPQDQRMAGLREVGMHLHDRDAGLVTHAVAMANWLRVHRFCPRCGGRLRTEQAGHVRRCEQCERQQFPRTDPAVIMLVTDGDERCLLAHNTRYPRERGYSTLAGFVEPGESLEHAVRREILEEVGVEVGEVTYAGSQPWPLPASLMVGFFAAADTTRITVDEHEISAARWFTRDALLAAAESGEVLLPGRISIARRLIESWYGGRLPGGW